MRKYYWILLFAVGLFSCTKVSKLSDTAEIVSFTILDQTEGIILNKDEITITNNVVTIPLDYGRKLFPLTIKADIKFSSTTDDVISVDEEPLNLKEITFKDVYTPQTFYLISESGIPLLGKIILKDKTNAEITNFHVTNYTEEEVSVAIRNNNIRINFKQDFNWPVTVEADITHNGKIKAGSAQSPFTFSGPKDQKQITLIADDNQDERVWNIQVVPTIENSNFESWINVDNSKVNIDPTPGKGLGWAKFLVGAYDCEKLFDVCIYLQKSFAFAGKRRVHNDLKAVYRRRAKEQSIHGQQDLMHRALGFIGKEYERL